jgi:hypothetical protein
MSTDTITSTAPYTVGFTVETTDLRQALRSTLVHAEQKGDVPSLHRVRLNPGPENLEVSASDTITAGLAIVSILGHDAAELEPIDLAPGDVKELLALFHGGAGGPDEPDHVLHIEASETHVRVTDTSGLFPGKSYTLVRYATDDNMPDLRRLFASMLRREPGGVSVAANGAALAAFKLAALAYRQPLVIESAASERSAILISCGESFLGALMPLHLDEERLAELTEWRQGWERRLPTLTSVGGPG